MALTVETLKIKTAEQIRDDYLRGYRNSLIKRGIENPNVSEGTEIFLRATALAQQAAVIAANVPVAANAQMPDTAQGDDLGRQAKIYKLGLRPAGPSAGSLVLSATVATPIAIPGGSQLLDPSGLSYEVAVGGPYADGDSIPLSSVDTGAATNLPERTTLRWTAPPSFVQPTALVGAGGLTGGIDAEDIEGLRARLLQKLQTPPNGVNWPNVAQVTEQSSTAVQKAFVYPAANGPSTEHIAVVRAPTSTNKNRDVDALILTSVITPAVLAAFPEFVEIVVTTVQNYPVSVSFGLALPEPPTATPAGPGGGWTDAQPFPQKLSDPKFTGATAVTDSTHITIESDIAPVLGSQICWLSTDDWVLRTAKMIAPVPTGASPYACVIDTPFVSTNGVVIAPGDFIFPNAVNMATYVAAVLAGFSKMGPYEKTGSPALLPRAARRPLASTSWLSELRRPFLRNLSDAGEEVTDVDYLYQSAVTPPLPAAITDGPFQIVPAQIGFYPLV